MSNSLRRGGEEASSYTFPNSALVKEILFVEWNQIHNSITENIIKTMPDTFKSILKMKRYITKD